MLMKATFVGILCVLCGTGGAWARSKFTITAPAQSGPQGRLKFTITRSDTTKMEAVYVRCADGTAVCDMHYGGAPEDVYFMPGQKTYEYEAWERSFNDIDVINDVTYTYQYGPESFRTYYVEVLDITGQELLASAERRIDYGDAMKVDLSIITNEVNEEIYLSNGEFATGLPEGKYIDMPYGTRLDSNEPDENGYYKITDKGYDQRHFTFPMYDMYKKFNFYTWYLQELDVTVCATLGFTMHEGEDGYRLNKTMMTYDQLTAFGVTVKSGENVYGDEGYFFWKNQSLKEDCVMDFTSFQGMQYTNLKVMRYAEVLLLAAEAHLLAGNSGKALEYVNKIRVRAGENPLNGVTMDDIKMEKRLELCNEAVRYQDLVRWGEAQSAMAEQGKEVPSYYITGVQWGFKNSTYGFKEKHNLLPIPLKEIELNPNMKQNPGW